MRGDSNSLIVYDKIDINHCISFFANFKINEKKVLAVPLKEYSILLLDLQRDISDNFDAALLKKNSYIVDLSNFFQFKVIINIPDICNNSRCLGHLNCACPKSLFIMKGIIQSRLIQNEIYGIIELDWSPFGISKFRRCLLACLSSQGHAVVLHEDTPGEFSVVCNLTQYLESRLTQDKEEFILKGMEYFIFIRNLYFLPYLKEATEHSQDDVLNDISRQSKGLLCVVFEIFQNFKSSYFLSLLSINFNFVDSVILNISTITKQVPMMIRTGKVFFNLQIHIVCIGLNDGSILLCAFKDTSHKYITHHLNFDTSQSRLVDISIQIKSENELTMVVFYEFYFTLVNFSIVYEDTMLDSYFKITNSQSFSSKSSFPIVSGGLFKDLVFYVNQIGTFFKYNPSKNLYNYYKDDGFQPTDSVCSASFGSSGLFLYSLVYTSTNSFHSHFFRCNLSTYSIGSLKNSLNQLLESNDDNRIEAQSFIIYSLNESENKAKPLIQSFLNNHTFSNEIPNVIDLQHVINCRFLSSLHILFIKHSIGRNEEFDSSQLQNCISRFHHYYILLVVFIYKKMKEFDIPTSDVVEKIIIELNEGKMNLDYEGVWIKLTKNLLTKMLLDTLFCRPALISICTMPNTSIDVNCFVCKSGISINKFGLTVCSKGHQNVYCPITFQIIEDSPKYKCPTCQCKFEKSHHPVLDYLSFGNLRTCPFCTSSLNDII